jgi:hypothetical protein
MNRPQTHTIPVLRRARILIAMGTVGLALVVASPASAEDTKPATTKKTATTTTTTTIDQGRRPAGDPAYRGHHTLEPSFSEL